MKLFPTEEVIVTSNENKIILTNHRMQMTDSRLGQSFTISIFLEDISSMETKYKSHIILIGLAVLSVLGGLYLSGKNGGSDALTGGVVLGAIFFAIWWFTRKHIISIASDGGSAMNFEVEGMGQEKVNEFIDNVSLAKLTRVNQLGSSVVNL